MRPELRLQSILKGHQIEERLALSRLAEVNDIVERRRGLYDKAFNLRRTLLDRIETYRHSKRHRAFAAGRINRIMSIDSYIERMGGELAKLQKDEQARSEELKSAEERAAGIEQELVDIRVEKKKIERYIENLTHRRRAAGVAREESQIDEMTSARTKRGN